VTLRNLHGKEGVDGSSPPEGSAQALQNGAFRFARACTFSSVRVDMELLMELSAPERALERGRERFLYAVSHVMGVGCLPSVESELSPFPEPGAEPGRSPRPSLARTSVESLVGPMTCCRRLSDWPSLLADSAGFYTPPSPISRSTSSSLTMNWKRMAMRFAGSFRTFRR
jgi:hypothetical protein